MSFDWKSTLATVAPAIAGLFGTPLAGMAVKAGLTAFGITDTPSDPKDAESLLASKVQGATTKDLLALKEADNTFKLEMEKLNIARSKLDVDDRSNARDMAKTRGVLPQVLLSISYTIAYAVVLYFFMSGQIQVQPNQQVLFGSLIGILTSAQVGIMNFWFGSSAGSKQKTDMLGKPA